MDKISLDFIILLTIMLTAYSGFKRGLFREGMIAVAYVPYMLVLFNVFHNFIQDEYTFDSFLYKAASLGGFYLSYLFVIWGVGKYLDTYFKLFDESILLLGRTIAGLISGARTIYFCFLCLIGFNIHIQNQEMIEKSQFAVIMQPYALKAQKYLIKNNYINDKITIYSDAANGTFDSDGNYQHPIMKRMMQSDRFKRMQHLIDKKDLKRQVDEHLNQYNY